MRCVAGTTEEFRVTVGLHQGLALSPFLFAIMMDCLAGSIQREAPWDMLFADDVVLYGEKKGKLRRNWGCGENGG